MTRPKNKPKNYCTFLESFTAGGVNGPRPVAKWTCEAESEICACCFSGAVRYVKMGKMRVHVVLPSCDKKECNETIRSGDKSRIDPAALKKGRMRAL